MTRITWVFVAVAVTSARPASAELVGSFGGGHGAYARLPHGWFIGADTGWAHLVGDDSSVSGRAATTPEHHDAWTFGARAGYQLASGLALQMRYDRLGVSSPDDAGTLSLASAGIRYSFPTVVMPFVEALVGSAFHDGDASPSAGLGIGLSAFISRHASIDLAGRDWLVDLGGIHHVPTLTLGFTAGFGG